MLGAPRLHPTPQDKQKPRQLILPDPISNPPETDFPLAQDYLHSLGKARTAQVQKDARIGEAEAKRDAGIRVREMGLLGHHGLATFTGDTGTGWLEGPAECGGPTRWGGGVLAKSKHGVAIESLTESRPLPFGLPH